MRARAAGASLARRGPILAWVATLTRWLFLLALLPGPTGGIHLEAQQPTRSPDVGFAPTAPEVVLAMLQLARVNATDIVYDLGSGDGRILIRAAKDTALEGSESSSIPLWSRSRVRPLSRMASQTRSASSRAICSPSISRLQPSSPCSCGPASMPASRRSSGPSSARGRESSPTPLASAIGDPTRSRVVSAILMYCCGQFRGGRRESPMSDSSRRARSWCRRC